MLMQTLSLCNSNPPIHGKSLNHSLPWHPSLVPLSGFKRTLKKMGRSSSSRSHYRRFTVFAVTEGSAEKSSNNKEEPVPAWAKLDSDEPPPWARNETQQESSSSTFELPYIVYLLASAVTAIAAIGSVFEYVNQRPVFGVLNSDSIFYAPLLGFFAFTGLPTSAFLWFKSVEVANKEAEEQDRRDGYR